MRVLLLRLLIAWWFIPCIYISILPIMYLIRGDFEDTLEGCNEIAHSIWTGEI